MDAARQARLTLLRQAAVRKLKRANAAISAAVTYMARDKPKAAMAKRRLSLAWRAMDASFADVGAYLAEKNRQ